MKITTKDIITVLPISDTIKRSLLDQWESMDQDAKFDIEQILWDAYDAIYDITLEENINLELIKASQEEVKLDNEFYKRMREKTDKQMQESNVLKKDTSELQLVREKLEKFINLNNNNVNG